MNDDGTPAGAQVSSPVTVGQVMALQCEGEAVALDPAQVRVVAVSQPQFTISLLSSEVQANRVRLQITSYRVGEHKDVTLVVTDDKNFFETEGVSWTVASVIDPQNPEAMKPFGSFGPWHLSWPLWYFVVVAAILLAVGFGVYRWIQFLLNKKRLKKEVEDYRKKHVPFDQFQKELRSLSREIGRVPQDTSQSQFQSWLTSVEQHTLTYLKMEFSIETKGASARSVVGSIKKRYRGAHESRLNDLFLFLSELQNMKSKVLAQADLEQALTWAQNISDRANEDEFGRPS